MSTLDRLITNNNIRAFVAGNTQGGVIRVTAMRTHGDWLRATGDSVEDCARKIEKQLGMPSMPTVPAMPGF